MIHIKCIAVHKDSVFSHFNSNLWELYGMQILSWKWYVLHWNVIIFRHSFVGAFAISVTLHHLTSFE